MDPRGRNLRRRAIVVTAVAIGTLVVPPVAQANWIKITNIAAGRVEVCAFKPTDTVRVVPLRCSLVTRGGTATWDDLAEYPVTLRAREDKVLGKVCLAGNLGNTTTRPGRPLQVTITGPCTIRASLANVDDSPLLWRAAQLFQEAVNARTTDARFVDTAGFCIDVLKAVKATRLVCRRWYRVFPEKLTFIVGATDAYFFVAFKGTDHDLPGNENEEMNGYRELVAGAPFTTVPNGNLTASTSHPGFEGVLTHRGWARAVQRLLPTVQDALQELDTRFPSERRKAIYITGHSMGGALAAYTAYRLMGEGMPARVRSVVFASFGTPHLGTASFNAALAARAGRFTTFAYSVELLGDPLAGPLSVIAPAYDRRVAPRVPYHIAELAKSDNPETANLHDGGNYRKIAFRYRMPPDRAPVAGDDALTVGRDSTAVVDVLANDVDADLDSLSVDTAAPPAPEHGSVSCVANGVCTYRPQPGYVGSDRFEYRVFDQRTGRDTGTVRITVTAAPALASPDLVLEKTASTGVAKVGDTVTFRLRVSVASDGKSTATATGVTLTDPLPAGAALVSASASRGPGCTGTAAVTCTLDDLPENATANVTIVVRLTKAGLLVNTATVTARAPPEKRGANA